MPALLSLLLPLLTGGAGSLGARALLARLLPRLAGKALPGMAADLAGFGLGQAAGGALLGERAVDDSGNAEAYSRLMAQGPQPAMEDQPLDYSNALSGMGVDMGQLTPQVY